MRTTDRDWMYQRLDDDGCISPVFTKGLKTFIEFACSKPCFMDGNLIKCPCKKKCKNRAYQEVDIAKFHLVKFRLFQITFCHGETANDRAKQVNASCEEVGDNHVVYDEFVKGQDRKRKLNELGSYGNSVVPSKIRNNSSKTYSKPQSDAAIIPRLEKISDRLNLLNEDLREVINKSHEQTKEALVVI